MSAFKRYASGFGLLFLALCQPLINATAQVQDTAYHMSDTIHNPEAYLESPVSLLAPNGEMHVIHTINQGSGLYYRVDSYKQNYKLHKRTQSLKFPSDAGSHRNAKIGLNGLVVTHNKRTVFFQKSAINQVGSADDTHRYFATYTPSSNIGDVLDVAPDFINNKYFALFANGNFPIIVSIDPAFPASGTLFNTTFSNGPAISNLIVIDGYGYMLTKYSSNTRIQKIDLSTNPLQTVYNLSVGLNPSNNKAIYLGEWNGKIIFQIGGTQVIIDMQSGAATTKSTLWKVPESAASLVDGDTLKVLTSYNNSTTPNPLFEFVKYDLANDTLLAHGYKPSLAVSVNPGKFVRINDTLITTLELNKANAKDPYCSLFNLKKLIWHWQTQIIPMNSALHTNSDGYFSQVTGQFVFYQRHDNQPTIRASRLNLAGSVVSQDTLYDPAVQILRDEASNSIGNKIYSAILSDTTLTRFRFENGVNHFVGKTFLPRYSDVLFAGKNGDYVVQTHGSTADTILYVNSIGMIAWSYQTQNKHQNLVDVEFSNNRIAFLFFNSILDGKLVHVDYSGNILFEVSLPSLSGYEMGNVQIELVKTTNQTFITYGLNSGPPFNYRVRLLDTLGTSIFVPSSGSAASYGGYADPTIRLFESRMLILEGNGNVDYAPLKIHEWKGTNFNTNGFSLTIPTNSKGFGISDARFFNNHYYITTRNTYTAQPNNKHNIYKIDTTGTLIWQKTILDTASSSPNHLHSAVDSAGIHMIYTLTINNYAGTYYRRLNFDGNDLEAYFVDTRWGCQGYPLQNFQSSANGPFATYLGGLYGNSTHNATLYLPGKRASLFLDDKVLEGPLFYNEQIKIIPNPSSSLCEIVIPEGEMHPVQLEIFTSSGKLVYTHAYNEEAIVVNVSTFAAGVYIVRAHCNGNNYNCKLLVN